MSDPITPLTPKYKISQKLFFYSTRYASLIDSLIVEKIHIDKHRIIYTNNTIAVAEDDLYEEPIEAFRVAIGRITEIYNNNITASGNEEGNLVEIVAVKAKIVFLYKTE